MEKVKQFVNDNYEFDKDDLNLHILYKKFNRIVDHLKINKNKKVFDRIINRFISDNNWCYIMCFICLVAANEKLLNQDEKIIIDIVEAVFESELSVTKYRFFSNLLLSNTITDWLHKVHDDNNIRYVPRFVLETIISDYDITKSLDRNLFDIGSYLDELLSDEQNIDENKYLFKNVNSFDEMASILENRMKEFNEFTMNYGAIASFRDETISDCKYIRKLKHLSFEKQEKALSLLHKLDEEDDNLGFIDRCNSIINAARILYQAYGEEKIINVDFAKKA